MIISLIVAVDENYGIGKDGDLLWYLPKDMAYFKATTLTHPVIMGRKNYFSIPKKYRPLTNRTNIVLTRTKENIDENVILCNSIIDAVSKAKKIDTDEIFVIGGGEIYKQFLEQDLIDKMYITHVKAHLAADTFFPKFNLNEWEIISEDSYESDGKNKYAFSIKKYLKKGKK